MQAPHVPESVSKPPIDFLWLELTNRCNLQCIHCYADSGPHAEKGTLSTPDYIELMTDAFALGCRRVQFIGGEPTLYRDLPVLIRTARQMGFEFIEIYTNLTILPDELLECFVANRVHVATSVYGPAGERHDSITLVDGSFEKTIRNLRRIVKAGLPVRAGIIEMEANAGYTDSTVTFLRDMGVQNVSVGALRHIGRGAAACESSEMSELCGNCAGATLCVSPAGVVSPCIMSKKWAVGSIRDASLSDIASGNLLRETRQRIYDAVASRSVGAGCQPGFNYRHAGCEPAYGAVPDSSCAPGVIKAGADCPPTFNAIEASNACNPSIAPVLRNLGADCNPTFSAIGVRAGCAPWFGPAETNIGADCAPSFPIGSSPSCEPSFAPAVRSLGADCNPMLSVIGAKADCPPVFNPAVAAPACPPLVASNVIKRPPSDRVA